MKPSRADPGPDLADTPKPSSSLEAWIQYRAELIAEFGNDPTIAPFIREADRNIARLQRDPAAEG